jgi:hypothetical protein
MQPLLSLRTLADEENRASDPEPLHPHQGPRLAERLRREGFEVRFLNQLPWRLPLPRRLQTEPRMQILNARAQLRTFDAVLPYAEGGLKFMASTISPRAPRMVPVLLTNRRPRDTAIGRAASAGMYATSIRRAAAVICCLRDIERYCQDRSTDKSRVFYAPTSVDAGFYDPALAAPEHAPAGLTGQSFVLAVGDSSRDDTLLYRAIEKLGIPLVRVTRDVRVAARVEPLRNAVRGDLVLNRVSFAQLRWLYTNARCCVITSSLDQWQAAGSTALTESSACGTPCVVQGGGCLEAEFRSMFAAHQADAGLRFVAPTAESIHEGIAWAVALTPADRAIVHERLRTCVVAELPIARAHDAFARALVSALAQ